MKPSQAPVSFGTDEHKDVLDGREVNRRLNDCLSIQWARLKALDGAEENAGGEDSGRPPLTDPFGIDLLSWLKIRLLAQEIELHLGGHFPLADAPSGKDTPFIGAFHL